MPIYIFIKTSGDLFFFAVAMLYIIILATNRWQLAYGQDQIGHVFISQILNLLY